MIGDGAVNAAQAIVFAVFMTVAVLLFLAAMWQPEGSPGRKARLRAATIFAVVGILVWFLQDRVT